MRACLIVLGVLMCMAGSAAAEQPKEGWELNLTAAEEVAPLEPINLRIELVNRTGRAARVHPPDPITDISRIQLIAVRGHGLWHLAQESPDGLGNPFMLRDGQAMTLHTQIGFIMLGDEGAINEAPGVFGLIAFYRSREGKILATDAINIRIGVDPQPGRTQELMKTIRRVAASEISLDECRRQLAELAARWEGSPHGRVARSHLELQSDRICRDGFRIVNLDYPRNPAKPRPMSRDILNEELAKDAAKQEAAEDEPGRPR